MKKCRHCNHIELGKQEMGIITALLISCNTTNEISIATGYNKKSTREVLYRLEKAGLVSRKNKIKKEIIWQSNRSCVSCKEWGWMSAFNTWSCSKSKGQFWYCNDYKRTK